MSGPHRAAGEGRRYLGALAVCLLLGCAGHPAQRDNGAAVLADQGGELSAPRADQVVRELNARAGSKVMGKYLADISSLSQAPVYTDNHAELLIDGPATYQAMLSAIEQADSEIFLETYIFADDEAGQAFAGLLARKSTQGVDVKVIYDSIGSSMTNDAFFQTMDDAGVQLIEFNEVNPVEGGNPLTLNNRDHRKLLVVDCASAFTGGINLSRTYSSRSTGLPRPDPISTGWRDTHVKISGPAVQGFRDNFIDHWRALKGEEFRALPEVECKHRAGRELVAIVTAKGGDGVDSAIFQAYLDAMQLASERIWITQAYFAPDERFMRLLSQAARRGVDVRLLVPGVSDSGLVLNASRAHYAELLEAGVRIFESSNDFLHAKTAVIDGVWSTVGSSNLDYRSFLHNDEINAVILGPAFGARMEAQFTRDLGNASEITRAQWDERPVWSRLKQKFSLLVKYWL